MNVYHVMWVTPLGAVFIETGFKAKDKESALGIVNKQIADDEGRPTVFAVETIDGQFIGMYNPDHWEIITPDDIDELKKEQNEDS